MMEAGEAGGDVQELSLPPSLLQSSHRTPPALSVPPQPIHSALGGACAVSSSELGHLYSRGPAQLMRGWGMGARPCWMPALVRPLLAPRGQTTCCFVALRGMGGGG